MIKCSIDKEINGIYFKIIYLTQQNNLNSFFSINRRDYYYVFVNLDNFSVLRENRDYNLLPDLRIDRLMEAYYQKQKSQANPLAVDYVQGVLM